MCQACLSITRLVSRVRGCDTDLNPVSESQPLHIQLSPGNSLRTLIHSIHLQHSNAAANIGLLLRFPAAHNLIRKSANHACICAIDSQAVTRTYCIAAA